MAESFEIVKSNQVMCYAEISDGGQKIFSDQEVQIGAGGDFSGVGYHCLKPHIFVFVRTEKIEQLFDKSLPQN